MGLPLIFAFDLVKRSLATLKIQYCLKRLVVRPIHIGRQPHYTSVPQHENSLFPLPPLCHGCGAYTQQIRPDEAGYFTASRKSVKSYLAHRRAKFLAHVDEGEHARLTFVTGEAELRKDIGGKGTTKLRSFSQPSHTWSVLPTGAGLHAPLCDRCHQLLYHSSGAPIAHPSIFSLQSILSSSPFKFNHIYHILDAADFPLSLVANLHQKFSLNAQRSKNRRAKLSKFLGGKSQDVTFIITRSDLLAPRKEQVDRLVPQLVQVLREALGEAAENARLSNVRCVSAKRGWWTPQLKEDIWRRGGGCWMLGKVNVGKSNLVECVFPKARRRLNEDLIPESEEFDTHSHPSPRSGYLQSAASMHPRISASKIKGLDNMVLPPPQKEMDYPALPLVSSMPGTTAAAIRLPFGGGSGELIDLPGLDRDGLEAFVVKDRQAELMMLRRPKPQTMTIKPGHSLLVGGLVRIHCLTPQLTILAYPFVSLECRVGKDEKIKAIHHQKTAPPSYSIAKPGIGEHMRCAGQFIMKWDVTKQRAGPLTRKDAVALDVGELPFVVCSLDVLIEGCGWIELVAQIRRKDLEQYRAAHDPADPGPFPLINVISPEGRHVGVRQPLNAWALADQKLGRSSQHVRPRKSMRGLKRLSR